MADRISVVVPVYNSELTLDKLVERLASVLSASWNTYEIILVDDGSTDHSYTRMCELYERYRYVNIIRLHGNFGQQNAVMCGLNFAQGDYIVTMDDDLQNPPEEIDKLIYKLREGFDVVYGIPLVKRHPMLRNFGTYLTDFLFCKVCGKPRNIKISSFRALKKDLLQRIIKDKSSFVYISAITFKNTDSVENVIVRHDAREYGNSGYNVFKLARLFVNLFLNYSSCRFVHRTSKSPQYVIGEKKLQWEDA